jgi:hypothetical protein
MIVHSIGKNMKTLMYIFGLLAVVTSPAVFAHMGGHDDAILVTDCKNLVKCTQDEVAQGGRAVITTYVNNSQLDKSWANVKTADSAKQVGGSWILNFKNPQEPDKTKQTLYIFISEEGMLEGLSHTAQY